MAPDGVLVRDAVEAGVDVPETGFDSATAGGGSSADGCIGEALRRVGGSSCNVADSCSFNSATVDEGSRALPSMMSRTSWGRVVEADRNSRRFSTVCTGLTLSLMARR